MNGGAYVPPYKMIDGFPVCVVVDCRTHLRNCVSLFHRGRMLFVCDYHYSTITTAEAERLRARDGKQR